MLQFLSYVQCLCICKSAKDVRTVLILQRNFLVDFQVCMILPFKVELKD